MKSSLSPAIVRKATSRLAKANRIVAANYPGESGRRQPVHTVYGGAQLFKADIARRLGELGLRTLNEYAPDARTLAKAIGLPGIEFSGEKHSLVNGQREESDAQSAGKQGSQRAAWLAETVYARVKSKLKREPVEDFRVDFEDGYGNRPDAEEDEHAAAAADETARGMAEGLLPAFFGIRIKPFSEELRARSIRTLDIFLTTVLQKTRGKLPQNFVVTQPKITSPEQVASLAKILDAIEQRTRLRRGAVKIELMVETTQSIFNAKGESALPQLVAAAGGRCTGAHFGTYDYTAACNITAAHQHMLHPACDFAKHMMQVSLAGTGIHLSDGATNVLPVPPHRPAKSGGAITPEQAAENRAVVHAAWKLHYEHIRHSLETAFYQGWDLHPAQLPTRYAAVYSFFLDGLEAASTRLRNFVGKAAQATLVGEVFDDAATGQGLLNYFLRAVNCGALTEQEAQEYSGLTPEELRSGSFLKILKNRKKN